MTLIGIISLPFLIISVVFIFLHGKFITLYNAHNDNCTLLRELLMHKLELLMFFTQDNYEIQINFEHDTEISQCIARLEEELNSINLTNEDSEEFANIAKEIEDVQNMYIQSREDFVRFTSGFPGKLFITFLVDKSMKL